MKIDIERFGLTNVPIDPETVFTFPEGIAGFEECKRFKLFHEEGKTTVFWLQSLDDTSLMFPIVAPDAFDIEYQIEFDGRRLCADRPAGDGGCCRRGHRLSR
ncbi:MAG: flagellar assembly protein FliW [Propionivibrio sp.]